MYKNNIFYCNRGACANSRESSKSDQIDIEKKCRTIEQTLKFGNIDQKEYKKAISICEKETKITEQVFSEELIAIVTNHQKLTSKMEKLVQEFYHDQIFYNTKTQLYNLQTLELLGPFIISGTKEEKVRCYYIYRVNI